MNTQTHSNYPEHGKNVYLIQRLQKPFEESNMLTALSNSLSFGGGLVNGGFSKEAWELVHRICRFDYMGSSEYEWGEVPRAIASIATRAKDFVAFTIEIDYKNVAKPWHRESIQRMVGPRGGKERDVRVTVPERAGKQTVYILSHTEDAKFAEKTIRASALDKLRCKERDGFSRALDPIDRWDSENCGWLELEYGFMFFTNKLMFENFSSLLGIEVITNASSH